MDSLQKWEDLQDLDGQEFDFDEFLKTDLLTAQKKFRVTMDWARRSTGTVSLFSSLALIYHVVRTDDGLSSTYHRLLFGLCVADLFMSLSCALNDTMVPEEMNYFIPHARGNGASCDANGFLLYFGGMSTILFNCSLCLYYLAIIKFNMKFEHIKKKLELWLLSIPILLPLFLALYFTFKKGFNVPHCFLTRTPGNYPPHCIGVVEGEVPNEGFEIPCGRGSEIDDETLSLILRYFGMGLVFVLPPVVIFGTMGVMYRTVLKAERNAQRNFAKSMRVPTHFRGVEALEADHPEGPRTVTKASIFGKVLYKITNIREKRKEPAEVKLPKSWNKAATKKRAILVMATGYSLAWFLTYAPYISYHMIANQTTSVTLGLFNPLQGFYNLIVYLYPKVAGKMKSRRGKLQQLKWYQALIEVWKSKNGTITGSTASRSSRLSGHRSSRNSRLNRVRLSLGSRSSNNKLSDVSSNTNSRFLTDLKLSGVDHSQNLSSEALITSTKSILKSSNRYSSNHMTFNASASVNDQLKQTVSKKEPIKRALRGSYLPQERRKSIKAKNKLSWRESMRSSSSTKVEDKDVQDLEVQRTGLLTLDDKQNKDNNTHDFQESSSDGSQQQQESLEDFLPLDSKQQVSQISQSYISFRSNRNLPSVTISRRARKSGNGKKNSVVFVLPGEKDSDDDDDFEAGSSSENAADA